MDTEVLGSFDKWKEFLGTQVDRAQAMGMSDEQITNVASHIGDYLSNKVDPKNPQERLLKQLWEVCDDKEQQTLARAMVRLSDKAH
jgi:hypothetical protein